MFRCLSAVRVVLVFGLVASVSSLTVAGPLHEAAWHSDLAQVKTLVATGHDVNARDRSGDTPLQRAAVAGATEIVLFLLDNGARVDTKGDAAGATPLNASARNGHVATSKLLVQRGANVNNKGHLGTTPVMGAVLANSLELVGFLLERGADPNIRNNLGVSPLGIATGQKDSTKMVDLLKRYGAKE